MIIVMMKRNEMDDVLQKCIRIETVCECRN